MTLVLGATVRRNWTINSKDPLQSKYRHGDTEGIISFIYCSKTREFNLGLARRHKALVQDFKTPLALFVRGIYLPDKKKIILRAYSIDDRENFTTQERVVEDLNLYKYKLKFNADSEELYYQYDWK